MNSATIREDAQHRLHSQLLQFLPKELADEVIRHHTSVTYTKDSIIFLQGSPADLMFWIMSGLVKLYCPRPDGNRTLVRLCGPGDVLGYADLIDPDHRHLQAFEAQALTKCTIALFTRQHALTMMEKLDQPTLLRLMTELNTAWSSIAFWFAEILGYSFRQRLDATLRDLAARFGVEDQRGTLLPMKLSHGDLAEMINGSRPMVTKLIGEMIEDHLIDRDGKRYIILNPMPKNGSARAQTDGHVKAQTNGYTNGHKNGKLPSNPKSNSPVRLHNELSVELRPAFTARNRRGRDGSDERVDEHQTSIVTPPLKNQGSPPLSLAVGVDGPRGTRSPESRGREE
jgi:CRP-like cAMP-binding protein